MVKRTPPCSPYPASSALALRVWGGVGGGGAFFSFFVCKCTPTPSPSPQGGGEHTECAACVSRYAIALPVGGRIASPCGDKFAWARGRGSASPPASDQRRQEDAQKVPQPIQQWSRGLNEGSLSGSGSHTLPRCVSSMLIRGVENEGPVRALDVLLEPVVD